MKQIDVLGRPSAALAGMIAEPSERLDAATALGAYLTAPDDPGGTPRRIRPGMTADLVLLDRPLATVLNEPAADRVRATFTTSDQPFAATGREPVRRS